MKTFGTKILVLSAEGKNTAIFALIMFALIVPIETVKLSTVNRNTRIIPLNPNRGTRKSHQFVHGKHREVPNALLRFALHPPHNVPE